MPILYFGFNSILLKHADTYCHFQSYRDWPFSGKLVQKVLFFFFFPLENQANTTKQLGAEIFLAAFILSALGTLKKVRETSNSFLFFPVVLYFLCITLKQSPFQRYEVRFTEVFKKSEYTKKNHEQKVKATVPQKKNKTNCPVVS